MAFDDISDLSSELSSVRSVSPSPPPEFASYPTPPGSQDTDGDSTPSNQSEVHLASPSDGTPPARKRRKIEEKPRTTQHLDLNSPPIYIGSQSEPLDLLIKTLRKKKKIVVVAGAGISVSAGSELLHVDDF